MRAALEGIMYPVDARSSISFGGCASTDHRLDEFVFTVPHSSWSHCSSVLNALFSSLRGRSFPSIFVLGPLHKGPVPGLDCSVFAPSSSVLSGSDWSVPLFAPSSLSSLVCLSDDVCSEECSLEIVAPYLSLLFPGVPVCHLLACGEVAFVAEKLKRDFPSSLFLLSNNNRTDCGHMWKEAFGL